jgi:catechol 2,3-dioxygenase-like lactoylglutathione lyase family enzyme
MTFLAATDKARAKSFFAETLGFKFITDDGFALVFGLDGTMLRVSTVKTFTPQPFTVLGWQVGDIRKAYAALVKQGIAFERYPFVEDKDGVWTAPDGTKVAWFKDPDGSVLSLTEFVGK